MKHLFEIDLSCVPCYLEFVGDVPKNEEEAWEITLSKWELLAQEERPIKVHDGGTNTCGLCYLYRGWHSPDGSTCERCPIYLHTGKIECQGTPYMRYKDRGLSPKEAHEIAKEELDFLRSIKKKDWR